MEMTVFSDAIGILSFIFAIVGSVLIAYGGLSATYKILMRELRKQHSVGYNQIRREFTSKIVFGLEFSSPPTCSPRSSHRRERSFSCSRLW